MPRARARLKNPRLRGTFYTRKRVILGTIICIGSSFGLIVRRGFAEISHPLSFFCFSFQIFFGDFSQNRFGITANRRYII